jgi:hypothetical protein
VRKIVRNDRDGDVSLDENFIKKPCLGGHSTFITSPLLFDASYFERARNDA